MGAGIRRLEIVRVVGAADPDAEGLGDSKGTLGHADLVGEAVRLDLREVVVASEDVRVPGGDLERPPLLSGQEQPRHFGVQAPGQNEEAVRVLGQQLLVDPGLVVEPLEVAAGDELDEIVVAGLVPDEDGDVVGTLVLPVDRGALEAAARSHVELAAQDGLDAGGSCLLVEIDRPEQVPVVSEGDGREAEVRRPVDQPLQARGAVEETVLRVYVEVNEVAVCRHAALSGSSRAQCRCPRRPRSGRGRRRACQSTQLGWHPRRGPSGAPSAAAGCWTNGTALPQNVHCGRRPSPPLRPVRRHSHSMVLGGLDEMS